MGSRRTRLHLGVGAALLALLLLGERPPDDPRFVSPARTVRTFWSAVRCQDPFEALECFSGVSPYASAARGLRLPSLRRLEIRNLDVRALGTDRAIVRYQVRYRARDAFRSGSFYTADELVRIRGQWRILRPMGGPSSPETLPHPRVHVRPGPEFA